MMRTEGPAGSEAGLTGYSARELQRVLREGAGLELPAPGSVTPAAGGDRIVFGTRADPACRALLDAGFLREPERAQGYSMRCAPDPREPARRLLAIIGSDAAGALYALRDLEHYELGRFRRGEARLPAEPFERSDYPRIAYRGHWTWGCNMPDKPAWIENMSRWKLNELIHWDNTPPTRAREYVDFAHARGVRVAWGFGWGWVPEWNYTLPAGFDRGRGTGVEMCGSSAFNRRFFREEIRRKVRELYAPTGCDGIYFQAFTECPKCQCPGCAKRTMGELMLEFVNPIVDDLSREFPGLWISCGIHYDFGDFSHLSRLDPRCNILWENCESGTSVRGVDEDFGYIHKSIPYGHGYGKDCPADPPFTEDSLRAWMDRTALQYVVQGGVASHRQYMRHLQGWARRFLGKPSARAHASVVADHSVFCRRTPFPHVALAEAQWNPDRDAAATVDGILDFLGLRAAAQRAPEPAVPMKDPGGKPLWMCEPGAFWGVQPQAIAHGPEGHAE